MSSKGKLAPAAPVANPNHINRGPAGANCAPKGKLSAPYASPRHKSATKAANIDKSVPGDYPKGMKGKNSTQDKSNPGKLPSKNRSNAGTGKTSGRVQTYTGPKGMRGSPEQAELVRGTASTTSTKAPTKYGPPPNGSGKNPR